MIQIDKRQTGRCLLLLLSLMALTGARVGAQVQTRANPDEQPSLPGNQVVLVGSSYYTSLEEAISKNTVAPFTAKLATSTTLSGKQQLPQGATIDLNNQTLTLYSGTELTIGKDKVLTITKGVLSGSLAFSGSLLIGADVSMPGVGVREVSKAANLYRILVTLPSATGTLSNLSYGPIEILQYARSGQQLCCWLPQSQVARMVTFSFQEQGSTGTKNFATEAVTVTTHAATTLPTAENSSVTTYKAKAKVEGESGYTSYESVYGALSAVAAKGGDVQLLSTAPLAESVTVNGKVRIDLAGNFLQASGTAALLTKGNGSVSIDGGSMAGNLTIGNNVLIPSSVVMAGCAVTKAGVQVYRVRVELPAGTTAATYTYGGNTGTMTAISEGGDAVAYLWLAAQPVPTTLTAKIGSDTLIRNNITVLTNHDNQVDLTDSDIAVILYAAGQTPGTVGTPFKTFHDALEAAALSPNSTLYLQTNAELSGGTDHPHVAGKNSVVTIELNGYTLTGGNCWLQATEEEAAFLITDRKGTGSLTGTFRSEGNLMIDGHIPASKIGRVERDVTTTQFYRVQVSIAELDKTGDGFGTYTFGSSVSGAFYYKDKTACLWLPVSNGKLELTVAGKTYTAPLVPVTASHANVATVHLPVAVARLKNTDYTSLADALAAAALSGGDVHIDLLSAAALDQVATVNYKLTVDLHEFTLTQAAGSGWKTANGGSVYLMSSEKGVLAGDFQIDGGFCAGAGVSLNGTVSDMNNPVYRVRFFLPEGATSADATYGNQAAGLILPGENRNKQVVGYAFLQPSGAGNLSVDVKGTTNTMLTLQGVSVQAFHNNQFDMESGTNPVRVEGDQPYNTFELALMAVHRRGGGTIILNQSLALSGLQSVNSDVTILLDGFTLALSTTAAFDVTSGKSLVISDGNQLPGNLYGTLLVNGSVYVSPEVRIAGMVIRDGLEVYRNNIEGLPADPGLSVTYASEGKSWKSPVLGGMACLWLTPVAVEYDQRLEVNGRQYEVTFLPTLPAHTLRYRAYPLVEVSGKNTWTDATYKDCNVYLKEGALLTIAPGAKVETLHRVTMENDTEIECTEAVLAEAGITYRRSFAKERIWEAFSLPYHARLIRSLYKGEVDAELRPYQSDGTGGDFWLKTISGKGEFNYVTEEQVVANTGYIIAVPENLTVLNDIRIDFVSSDRQYLNRSAVPLPVPEAGTFVQVAPGTLRKVKMDRPFYQLSTNGTEYARVDASATAPMSVSPFSSILLSDARTMAANSVLRMSSLPTSIGEVLLPDLSVRVYGQKGGICLNCDKKQPLRIYSLSGTLVWQGIVEEGSSFVPLPVGFYVVNREKVMVR